MFERLALQPEDGTIERFQIHVNGISGPSQNDPTVRWWYSFTIVLSGQIRIASNNKNEIQFLPAQQFHIRKQSETASPTPTQPQYY